MTALVWFRRDLRVHDLPALRAALAEHERVVPVFCLDDRLLHGRHASGPRTAFLLESLADLNRSLRERGGGLVIRRGRPEQELVALAEETGATAIHFTCDVSPFARERGERAHPALALAGLELRAHPGLNVVDDVGAIRTQNGDPYTVFSPFWRNWIRVARRDVLPAPRRVDLPEGVKRGEIPSLADLGLAQEVTYPPAGGEGPGRERMKAWLRSGVTRYERRHDPLDAGGTSRLSPYLHFGCVSPRELEQRLPDDSDAVGAFRRQLCWRDFHHAVLLHFPDNAFLEFQERFRDLEWSNDEAVFRAWTEGRTGFPLVDAGMRQLRREGWMHNRARLVVASFLTKDLGVDWRWGERWFMRLLVDGDEANNNGNWQWIASVGVDPQPYFRRMYNPARHMERFDPKGGYVREYVPELRPVPDRYLREPWTMPREVQEEVGCVIGRDYPEPIVDRRRAREAAKQRYGALAGA
jgi:deoxyribodipyrimidine photo-lyase